jgi:hypothetical protein
MQLGEKSSKPNKKAMPTLLNVNNNKKKLPLPFLKVALSTRPLLSASQLQGRKSNLYVHNHLLMSNCTGFHSRSETVNQVVMCLEVKKMTKIVIKDEVIIL